MRFHIVLALTLMALGCLAEKSKGRKSFILPSNLKLRQIDVEQLLQNQNGYEYDDGDSLAGNIESEPVDGAPSAVALKPDSSSGRLFFKKFFLSGKQTPPPQIIIITRPEPTNPTSTDPSTISFTGNITTSPIARGGGGDVSGDYISDEDDEYEEDIANEKPNARKVPHTTYKLVKGKANQQGLSFVVPSKYMRNFKNKRNSVVVNPSATYNNGASGSKVKKVLLSNNGNGIVKRKRSRSPVRRFIVSQN